MIQLPDCFGQWGFNWLCVRGSGQATIHQLCSITETPLLHSNTSCLLPKRPKPRSSSRTHGANNCSSSTPTAAPVMRLSATTKRLSVPPEIALSSIPSGLRCRKYFLLLMLFQALSLSQCNLCYVHWFCCCEHPCMHLGVFTEGLRGQLKLFFPESVSPFPI